MIRIPLMIAVCALGLVAACGVDGPPSAPERSGVTFSGEASLGVVGTF